MTPSPTPGAVHAALKEIQNFFKQKGELHLLKKPKYKPQTSLAKPKKLKPRTDLKYYADASSTDWRRNVPVGVEFDIQEAMYAMVATRVASEGQLPAPAEEFWTGFPKEGLAPAAIYAAFADIFLNAEKPDLYCRPLITHTDELEFCSGYFGRKDAAVYVQITDTTAQINVVAYEGSPVLAAAKNWADTYIETQPPAGTVYMMTMGPGGPQFTTVGSGGAPLERANYTQQTLDAYDRIKEELVIPAPRGRLSILSGTPGSGKTYIIRGLLNEVLQAIFIIVPQHALTSLADPSGLSALTRLRDTTNDRPMVLVLEDADDALAPRKEGETSVLSALLNIGDGIMGSALDLRILATTNRLQQEFDAAILRPGRLSTAVEVDALPAEKANEILVRLLGDKASGTQLFEGWATIAEVYQRAYDSGWKPVATKKRRSMGFGS